MFDTIMGVRSFFVILLVWYMTFGTAFYFVNMNAQVENANLADDDQASFVPNINPLWVVDAASAMYELSLGEFRLEDYEKSTNTELLYLLFWVSTFFLMVVFLNMLIANMGDTFEQATNEKDKNARMTEIAKISAYSNLIMREDKDEYATFFEEKVKPLWSNRNETVDKA